MSFNSSLIDIYVGEDGKLHKVQGGADSVLPFNSGKQIIDLGTGASFDVSSYSGYQSFTANNFIIEPSSNNVTSFTSNVSGFAFNVGSHQFTVRNVTSLVKSYNASNGILTAYINGAVDLTCYPNGWHNVSQGSVRSNVHAYLIIE